MVRSEWDEACEKEAESRTYEIAGRQIRAGKYDGDKFGELSESFKDLRDWRSALSEMGLSKSEIESEVSRLCGLASGRLVRVSDDRHEVQTDDGKPSVVLTEEHATRLARAWRKNGDPSARAVCVRVTRIRRAK